MKGQVQRVGDAAFVKVDMKREPGKCEPGTLHDALNIRLDSGDVVQRGGCVTPVFGQISGSPRFYGSGVYSDPNGLEYMALVASDKLWLVRDGQAPLSINMPIGITIGADCDPVQAFNTMILFRGTELAPLEWDGELDTQLARITQSAAEEESTYVEEIPDAVTGESFNNRVLVPFNRDRVAVSDLLDYTRYDPALNEFRINQGSDDKLVRIKGWFNNQVVMFKDQSIYLVQGVFGDLSQVRLDMVNDQIGLAGRRAVVSVGGDLLFLSNPGGVYQLSQVLENRVSAAPVPLSEPIEPVVNRINWAAASGAVAAAVGEYAYFAVPLDGADYNNAVLVLNTRTMVWESVDTYPDGLRLDNLLVSDWFGARHLFGVDHTNGTLVVLDYGDEDEVSGIRSEISWLAETRGYGVDHADQEVHGFFLSVATSDPRYSVVQLSDGVSEERVVINNRTRDRTKYFVHGKGIHDVTNAGDDHAARGRQDYSVTANTTGWEPNDAGIAVDQEQEFTEQGRLRGFGRFVQLRITGDQGRTRVRGAGLELRAGRRSRKLLA